MYLHEVTPSSLLCVVGFLPYIKFTRQVYYWFATTNIIYLCAVGLLFQTYFYLKFKVADPKHIVGKRTFEGLKPFFVKPMKE